MTRGEVTIGENIVREHIRNVCMCVYLSFFYKSKTNSEKEKI